MGDIAYIGDKRNRDNDVIVISIADGKVLVDNTDLYYGVNHLWNKRPGTVEYLTRHNREDSADEANPHRV